MKQTSFNLLLALVGLTLGTPAVRAQGGELTWGMGGTGDPVGQAATASSRGMQAKRQAEAKTDPKARLYAKAKDELTKSVRFSRNFDALPALGQVYLALGNRPFALAPAPAPRP